MASMKDARGGARRRLIAVRNWAFMTFTDQGRALEAFIEGAETLELRLRIDNGIHETKLSSIEDIGWQLIDRVDEVPMVNEESAARYAVFNFVRRDKPTGT